MIEFEADRLIPALEIFLFGDVLGVLDDVDHVAGAVEIGRLGALPASRAGRSVGMFEVERLPVQLGGDAIQCLQEGFPHRGDTLRGIREGIEDVPARNLVQRALQHGEIGLVGVDDMQLAIHHHVRCRHGVEELHEVEVAGPDGRLVGARHIEGHGI